MTWEEALRINAALVVIGDERADYGEWRAGPGKKPAPSRPIADPGMTLADYQRELDQAQSQRDAATKLLQAHRRALVTGESEGRLVDEDVLYWQERVDEFSARTLAVQAKIEQLVADVRKDGP